MTSRKNTKLVLPALRGVMGNWVYYSCLMDTINLAGRVSFATEVHKSESLSKMIQRQLNSSRSSQISEYLKKQPERFFNSLVVATYGGEPVWYPLSDLKSRSTNPDLADLSEETLGSVGFLTLQGSEKLFALDGQHRLAGIKKAVKEGVDPDDADEISVILVAHKETPRGLERTRRLFTTLNKTARPVSKGDIIALDEDDVMALTVRWLIEETDLFSGERLAFVASNNMPTANTSSLTTIGNLYDVLTILFTAAHTDLKKTKSDLQRVRPSDAELRQYFQLAKTYFTAMGDNFRELQSFFAAKDTSTQVKKFRGSHGGSALFRPIGLELFTRIVATLSADLTIEDAVASAAKLPTTLTKEPFVNLLWDPTNRTISNSHKVTLRETLLYMLNSSKFSDAKLLERYRRETGNDQASLPRKVR
jgi:DNA sulfur modification protein DndB